MGTYSHIELTRSHKGRQSENICWSLPINRPIFSWTDNSITHRSPMNPTVKKRSDLQVSRQQLNIHTGSTANFLTREDNSRDLLGTFHKDRSVWIRARRRFLQCLSYQFPCALQLKKWGILNDVKCRLCEKYYKEKRIREPPDSVESVGHIQCYCPVLQLPRIAIHHGIWRELMFSIRKSSTELNDASELRWHFPSALSPEAHAEWGLYRILEYKGLHEILPPGAGQNRAKLRKNIEEYHIAYGIDFDETDIDTFIARRPDGLAFDKEKKLCVFLEYTRAMDTNEDWAEKKEQGKIDRYSSHLGFINHLSNREKSGWKASQTNFTTGVRGTLHTNQFLTRLESLGVKNKNTQEAIHNRTVQNTLSMSDMILKFFLIALNSKTQWTLQTLPTEIANKYMERFNLHLQQARMWTDHITSHRKGAPIDYNPLHTLIRFLDQGAKHTHKKQRIQDINISIN